MFGQKCQIRTPKVPFINLQKKIIKEKNVGQKCRIQTLQNFPL